MKKQEEEEEECPYITEYKSNLREVGVSST